MSHIVKIGNTFYRVLGKVNGKPRYEHIYVAEKIFGGPLPEGYEVHHKDENGLNNDPSNLVICKSKREHKELHRRMKALAACGHEDWLVCVICGKYDDPKNLYVWARKDRGGSLRARHEACYKQYNKEWRASKKPATSCSG